MNVMNTTDIRHEQMRIGGEMVDTDARLEVRYPYTDEVIGTVPMGTAEHARRAFEIAANYTPKLTRYERSQILQRAGELIGERRDYLAKWLTLELGICHQHAIYETKRAQDVYQFAAAEALKDDGEIFSCDLTHNGKARKIFLSVYLHAECLQDIEAEDHDGRIRQSEAVQKFRVRDDDIEAVDFEVTNFKPAAEQDFYRGDVAGRPDEFDVADGIA